MYNDYIMERCLIIEYDIITCQSFELIKLKQSILQIKYQSRQNNTKLKLSIITVNPKTNEISGSLKIIAEFESKINVTNRNSEKKVKKRRVIQKILHCRL